MANIGFYNWARCVYGINTWIMKFSVLVFRKKEHAALISRQSIEVLIK